MKTPARFLALVLLVFGAAAALMVPRPDEWLAVLHDEGREAGIISLLEPRLAREPNNPTLLATLARSYAETRDYPRAVALMERYVGLRPGDGDAYARLANLYEKTGNIAAEIEMLERAIDIQPGLPAVSALADLYRQAQRGDDERALFARFQTRLRDDSALVLRAAELRNEDGDRDGAIALLMHPAIVLAPSKASVQADARIFLAGLLVDAGRSAEAVDFARQWIPQWREPWLANRVLSKVALGAPLPQAEQLADAVVATHPEIRLFLVHTLAQAGTGLVARHLLATWIDANPSPSDVEIAAFLSMCREQDDPAIVWHTFAAVLGPGRSVEVASRFSRAIAATFGIGSLAPFWAELPPDLLRRDPVLAAQLAFSAGDSKVAAWLLSTVDVGSLSAGERRVWMDLLMATTSPADAVLILQDRGNRGNLPVELLSEYTLRVFGRGEELKVQAQRESSGVSP